MTQRISPAPVGNDRARAIVVLGVLAAFLVRLIVAARVPLLDDEAYYWLWSRHLAWGYPDHPPMIAALISIATRLFGDSPFAIRLIPLLFSSATPVMGYLVGRDLFDGGTGRRSALLLVTLPVAVIGTTFAFPDGPMTFFWMLAVWLGWHALQRGGWWWVATGAAVGLAFLGKEMALFLVLGLAVAWVAGPRWRSLRDPGWYAGIALALALALPVVLWNAQHDWATVRIAVNREPWTEPRSIPENLLAFAGGLLVFFGPLAFVLLGAAVAAARRLRDPAWRYLAWMSWPSFAAVLLTAAGARAKPHWPAAAYASAAVALAALWPQWWPRRRTLIGLSTALTLALTLALAGVVSSPLDTGFATDHWRSVARVVQQEAETRKAFVLTRDYQSASQMLYYLDQLPPSDQRPIVTTPYRTFPSWQPTGALKGRNVLYLEARPVSDPSAAPSLELTRLCRQIHKVDVVPLDPRRVVALYGCADFTGSFAGLSLSRPAP